MTPFFWSGGQIGWPLFGLVVFSVCCLIVADIVWRAVQIRFRKLLLATGIVWAVGAAITIVLYCI